MNGPGPHCWRRIGIHGDRSCPELVAQIHCRNCAWFARGARELLSRPGLMVVDPLEGLTTPHVTPGLTGSVLVFRLGSEWYALSTTVVREIAEARPVCRIAHRVGRLLEGLVNIRGELQLCVALDRLLGSARSSESPARLVLAEVDGQGFGFFADEVRGVERLAELSIEPPPAAAPPALQQVVRQLLRLPGGRAALLLEPEPLYRRIRQEAF
jgi:chemotaxis-related protein WspD